MTSLKRYILLVLLVTAFATAPAAAGEKYVITIPVVKGLSVGSLSNMIKQMATVISKKSGFDLEIKEMNYNKGEDDEIFLKLLNDMKSGGSQFALVNSPLRFVKFEKQAGDVMVPSFAVSLFNKKMSDVCIYSRKSDPGKSIADFKGKRWGGVHSAEARYLMHAGGFDVPMKDFFSKVIYVDDTKLADPLDALINNKIDSHVTLSYIGRMAINSNKKYQDGIKETACAEYEHNWIFFYKKGTPKEVVEKLKGIMLNATKDKDFNQFKFMLTAIKGNFVEYDPADMATTRKIAALTTKYGWDKEEKEFVKNKPK